MAELEKFFIRYEADTRKMESALKRIERKTGQTNRKIDKGFRGAAGSLGQLTKRATALKAALVAAVPVAVIGGLAALAKNAINAADNIAKTADKVGLTTDELQELRFAAEQAGVGAKTLDLAMQRFSRRIGEAAQGTGELHETLKRYNIGILDSTGRTRANVEILGDLANAIKGAKSDQEALRIAFKAFDSEGAALVNLLRNGADGLDRMRQKARDLGIVMSADLIRRAEDAKGKIDALAFALRAKLNVWLLENAQAISELADSALRALPKIVSFIDAVTRAIGIGRFATGGLLQDKDISDLTIAKQQLKSGEGPLLQRLRAVEILKRRGVIKDAPSSNKELINKIDQALGQIMLERARQFGAGVGAMFNRPGKQTFTTPPRKGGSGAAKGKTFGDVLGQMRERARALEMEAEKVGMTEAAWQRYKVVQDAIAFAKQNNIPLSEKQIQQIEAEAAKIGVLQEKLTAAQEAAARLANAKQTLVDFGERIGQAFEDSVIAALDRTGSAMEKLKDIGRSLVDELLRQMLRLSVINPLMNAFSEALGGNATRPTIGGVGGVLGKLFQGKFASGGPVRGNRAALVGERGPELFVPNTSGRIMSNRDTQRMGGDTYYIDARGADQSAIARLERTIREVNGSIERRAVAATADARIRGVLA